MAANTMLEKYSLNYQFNTTQLQGVLGAKAPKQKIVMWKEGQKGSKEQVLWILCIDVALYKLI